MYYFAPSGRSTPRLRYGEAKNVSVEVRAFMKTRRLGETDLDLTLIGLGTWAIGGEWAYGWGPQDEAESESAILEALELGVNWIDTAPAYGLGHAETVIGRCLKQWKKRGGKIPIIATKCGLVGQADRTVYSCLTRDSIIDECEQSLRRLGVEQIDLYQIHWPNPPGDIGEGFQTLLELQKQGKIRWAGVSNFSASQLRHVGQYGLVASLQPPYSMVSRGAEENALPWCLQHSIGVIAYSPLQSGLLTGKVTVEWIRDLPEGDWRKKKLDFFREPKLSQSFDFIERIKQSSVIRHYPLSELAIQWVLKRPGVTSAICGARKPGQISEIVKALSWEMTDVEMKEIDAIFEEAFGV